MALKVTLFAHLDEPVFCHGGIPHQVRAGRVILRIFHRNAQVTDNALHQRLHNVIGHIVLVWLAEISFHDVA